MRRVILTAILIFALSVTAFAAEAKTYYPNGKVQMEMNDTGMKSYYENGQLMSESVMENDQPVMVKTYYEKGQLSREDDFLAKTWKQYGEDGKLIMEGKL